MQPTFGKGSRLILGPSLPLSLILMMSRSELTVKCHRKEICSCPFCLELTPPRGVSRCRRLAGGTSVTLSAVAMHN